jgi:hypothetical protein
VKQRGKRVDQAQKKARRQKRIVIGGGVLLLALLAFQLPKMLKHNAPPVATPPAPAPTSTASSPSSDPATPALVTAQPASSTAPQATLPSETAANASEGQLISFSQFRGRDPFKQQLPEAEQSSEEGNKYATPTTSSTPAPSTPPVSSPPSTSPPSTSPPSTSPTSPTPTPPSTTPPTSTGPSTAPATASATISVNGTAETVAVGDAFPKANPLFRLVSIKNGVARIGIAGGTLKGSTKTVALVKGKTLTLMNTADGMRYVLRLL